MISVPFSTSRGRTLCPQQNGQSKAAIQLALQSVGEGFRMLRFLMDEYDDDLPIT